MPPIYQDPLSAVPGAQWTWLDILRALLEVSCEPWALALVGLAAYSFLDRDVKGTLKAFLPLAIALAAAGALALGARALGGLPRPLDGSGRALGPFLRHAFPSSQAAAVAAFATYTALAYGRRARPVVLVAAAVGIARALGGPYWVSELGAGALTGVLVGAGVHAVTLRLLPAGHVARLRAERATRAAATDPGSP